MNTYPTLDMYSLVKLLVGEGGAMPQDFYMAWGGLDGVGGVERRLVGMGGRGRGRTCFTKVMAYYRLNFLVFNWIL